DRAEAVSRRAVQRSPPAPREVRQAGELELPVRVRAQLSHCNGKRVITNASVAYLFSIGRGSESNHRDYKSSARKERHQGDEIMQPRSRKLATLACTALAGVSILALTASQPQAQYKITVNKERLLNAQNEPQNWLMQNGDYGSQRYSKLTQINRDNVKDLRMVWALALSGMQNVGQNGPDNQVNPLIDNGFMYTSDGWGGVY